MSRSDALKRAQAKYAEKYRKSGATKSFYIKYHREHDKQIIEKLESVENKNGYIRDLIQADIEKQG